MDRNLPFRRRASHFLPLLLFPFFLALCLSGCGPQSLPVHTFQGRMQVYTLPDPYLIPESIAPTADGNLWFPVVAYSNFGTNKPSGAIGRVMPGSKITLFSLPTNCYPSYITSGSDGKLWFLAYQGQGEVQYGTDTPPGFSGGYSEIGSITPSGQIHLMPLPASPQRSFETLVSGPDGNLWGSEVVSPNLRDSTAPHVREIGRVTPSGQITDYPLPPSADSAGYFATGPDGNLWFTVNSHIGWDAHGKVGRISPQGQMTIFDLPANIFDLFGITSGSDGNLWLEGSGYIVRLTPIGQVKEYSLQALANQKDSNSLGMTALVAGPDGALWFLTNNHWIGRLTTDGALTKLPYPASVDFPSQDVRNALPTPVFGSDGTFWITWGNELGRFV